MAWYDGPCNNYAVFLGCFVALILLCWVLNVACMAPGSAMLIPDAAVRETVQKASFNTSVVLFMVGVLILFACANGGGGE